MFERRTLMTQYLLSVFSGPDTTSMPPEVTQKMYRDVNTFNGELKSAGAWVFAGGLHPADTATVVQVKDGDVLITDGPFAEAKEHIGGFWVIDAPDLDAALAWTAKATRACAAPVELRPFQEEPPA
jgi:hypothetical protein